MSRSQVLALSLPSLSRIPVPCIAVAPLRRQNHKAPCHPLSVNMSDSVTYSLAYLLYIIIKHSNLRIDEKKKTKKKHHLAYSVDTFQSVSHQKVCFGSPLCVCVCVCVCVRVCVFSSNSVAELTNYSAFVYFAGADFLTRLNYSRTRRVWLFLPSLLFKKYKYSHQDKYNTINCLLSLKHFQ